MNNHTLQKSLRIAKSEYIKWLRNPRMLIGGILVIVIYTLAVVPLLNRTQKMGIPMNIFEPMIAVGNSGLLVLLLPSVFLILQSDYPVIEPNSLMYLSRTGKKAWLIGQILFSLMSIVTYLLAIFIAVGICSAGGSYFGLEWSESTRMYIAAFPDDRDSFASSLLPSNLYNQITLGMAMVYTFSLLVLYFFLLMLVLLVFSLRKKRKLGLFLAFAIIMLGVVTCATGVDAMWALPMANSIIWLHYTEILSTPVYPIINSYLYFGGYIGILLVLSAILIRRAEFESTEVLQ